MLLLVDLAEHLAYLPTSSLSAEQTVLFSLISFLWDCQLFNVGCWALLSAVMTHSGKSPWVNQLSTLLLSFVLISPKLAPYYFPKNHVATTALILPTKYSDLPLSALDNSGASPEFLFVEWVGGMFCPVACGHEFARFGPLTSLVCPYSLSLCFSSGPD